MPTFTNCDLFLISLRPIIEVRHPTKCIIDIMLLKLFVTDIKTDITKI
jgi:hypothetical protein